ncbi:hypothetical protein T484DRAFT_3641974, partial [Baffinella frigidus]
RGQQPVRRLGGGAPAHDLGGREGPAGTISRVADVAARRSSGGQPAGAAGQWLRRRGVRAAGEAPAHIGRGAGAGLDTREQAGSHAPIQPVEGAADGPELRQHPAGPDRGGSVRHERKSQQHGQQLREGRRVSAAGHPGSHRAGRGHDANAVRNGRAVPSSHRLLQWANPRRSRGQDVRALRAGDQDGDRAQASGRIPPPGVAERRRGPGVGRDDARRDDGGGERRGSGRLEEEVRHDPGEQRQKEEGRRQEGDGRRRGRGWLGRAAEPQGPARDRL